MRKPPRGERPRFASIRFLLFPRRLRIGMAFCAAIATAAVLGACGSGVPGDAVASVSGVAITKTALQHWLVVANNTTQASTGAAAPPLPVPPNYTACVASERKQPSDKNSSLSSLKQLCAQSYQSLLSEIMNFLIQSVWLQGEAVDRGVKVTNAQVTKAFNSERDSSTTPVLKTNAEFNAFLAKAGETAADLRWRTYLSLLANAISVKVEKQASVVTNAAIVAYYHKHLAALTTPETRDLHLVETSSEATAAKVKALLAAGSSYAALAPKYSVDPTTKNVGGKLTGVRAGELNTQLNAAVFAATPGVVTGPLKTAFGYYVFTVDSSTPRSVPTLKAATPTIKQTLSSQQETAANAALDTDFTSKWTSRTTCATGYIVSSCGNAPKTSSTSATGATSTTG